MCAIGSRAVPVHSRGGGGGGGGQMSWHDVNHCYTFAPPTNTSANGTVPGTPSNCILWGIAYEQLIFTASLFVFLVPLGRVWMSVLVGAFFSAIRTHDVSRTAFKEHFLPWGVRAWRWGFSWLCYTELYVPPGRVNDVLWRLVSIPFCILLIFAVDQFMFCLSKLVVWRVKVSPASRLASKDPIAGVRDSEKGGSSAIAEVMLMLRMFVDLLVVIGAFSLQDVQIVLFLNVVGMYTLGVAVALMPLGTMIYNGLVALTLGTVRVGQTTDIGLGRGDGVVEASSVTRALVRNYMDDVLSCPHSLLATFSSVGARTSAGVRMAFVKPVAAGALAAIKGVKHGAYLECDHDELSMVIPSMPGVHDSELLLLGMEHTEDMRVSNEPAVRRSLPRGHNDCATVLLATSFEEISGLDEAFLQAHSARAMRQTSLGTWTEPSPKLR